MPWRPNLGLQSPFSIPASPLRWLHMNHRGNQTVNHQGTQFPMTTYLIRAVNRRKADLGGILDSTKSLPEALLLRHPRHPSLSPSLSSLILILPGSLSRLAVCQTRAPTPLSRRSPPYLNNPSLLLSLFLFLSRSKTSSCKPLSPSAYYGYLAAASPVLPCCRERLHQIPTRSAAPNMHSTIPGGSNLTIPVFLKRSLAMALCDRRTNEPPMRSEKQPRSTPWALARSGCACILAFTTLIHHVTRNNTWDTLRVHDLVYYTWAAPKRVYQRASWRLRFTWSPAIRVGLFKVINLIHDYGGTRASAHTRRVWTWVQFLNMETTRVILGASWRVRFTWFPWAWYDKLFTFVTLVASYLPTSYETCKEVRWVGANQPVPWFLGGKGLSIQQGTSVWVGSPKSVRWSYEKESFHPAAWQQLGRGETGFSPYYTIR